MLDKKDRIVIQKEFKVVESGEAKVHFYYSPEEKLFFILPGLVSTQYLVGIRKIDNKNRVCVPKEIIKMYKTANILFAQKGARVYLLPIKED